MASFKTIRLILGDQLNSRHSWFSKQDGRVLYLMMEVRQETDYVKHHVQKLMAFFAAMREFAAYLKGQGHAVKYIRLDDADNRQEFDQNIRWALKQFNSSRFEYLSPDEYRLDEVLKEISRNLWVESKVFDTEHFMTGPDDVENFFKGRKRFLMESFYRFLRKKHQVLMDQEKPTGGRWNYDALNRKPYDKKVRIPEPMLFKNDVSTLMDLINRCNVSYFGDINPEKFYWPVNLKQSQALLDYFVQSCLPYFGAYQDAMTSNGWSLFHSRLSFSLNTKMLHPMDVIQAVLNCRQSNTEKISIEQVEGFVRQILGWREYMRGAYWALMPNFGKMNYFSHNRRLPGYFWNADTKMNCMKLVLKQSLERAYAHHIQRLMVTGNFCLLAGIHPDEVDAWYLGVYIDAVEWVEKPNTRGMSQYADGGIIATKPYVSSASYINKMSDYCKDCSYHYKMAYGNMSCPFNSLFWDFHHRHRDLLGKNPRIQMMYRTWDKKPGEQKEQILAQARKYMKNLETL